MSVNIRNYVSNDHIESIGEIAKSQSVIIQALSLDNSKLEREIERLNNIIDNAIDFLKENACIDEDVEYFCDDLRYDDCKKLLDILKGSDKE